MSLIRDPSSDEHQRTQRTAFFQLCLATLPLFIVLCFFLIVAHNRPNHPFYTTEDDQVRNEIGATDPGLDLMQMLYVFLAFLVLWTSFLAHLNMFIPKRRALIHRYIETGETLVGDVWYDSSPGRCKIKRSWLVWNCSGCFGLWAKEYANLVYKVNVGLDGGERATVTKCVRTYKPWSRERSPILVLPGLPRSGLPKSDVEIDVKAQGSDLMYEVYYLICFWIVFLLCGSIYVVTQMAKLSDEVKNLQKAWTVLLCVVLFHGPLLYAFTWLRFYHYRRWLTNSGSLAKTSKQDVEKAGEYSVMS